MLQKSSLPYFYSEDDDNKEERGKGDSEEKEKKEGDRRVGVYGGVWMMKRQGRGGGGAKGGGESGEVGMEGEDNNKGVPHGWGQKLQQQVCPCPSGFQGRCGVIRFRAVDTVSVKGEIGRWDFSRIHQDCVCCLFPGLYLLPCPLVSVWTKTRQT